MHLREFPRQSLAAFVKGNQRVKLGILVLFLLASLLPLCQGTGMIEVHFLSYANPRHNNFQNRCCSGSEVQGRCSSPCRTFFTACVGLLINIQGCFFGRKSSDVLGNSSFVIPTNSLLQIPWPGNLQSWPGSFALVVTAKHQGVSSSVLIEEDVVRSRNLLPGTQWHNVSHVGTVANITFSYRVVCQLNYYGDSCSTYCLPRNDSNGHYTCDSQGTRVCLPGWSGSFCTEAVCREGCHPNHGSCLTPNTCNCASGWDGPNCTQCLKHPRCVHGTCNVPWECNCGFGWGGSFCDDDLEVCSRRRPCQNGASCTNIRGGYVCTCKKGFTGKNCSIEINECASDPCFNGGNCTNLIGDFNCSCPEGYSGKQCYPDCGPDACLNGGTCVNGMRGYHCMCKTGFSGSSCEIMLPTVSTNHPSSNDATNDPISTRESTTNGTVDTTSATATTKQTTKKESMGETYNSEKRSPGITKQTTMIVSIVVSLIILLLCIVACVAWKFWRKRRRDADNVTAGGAAQSVQAANSKQIDIEDPDSKHCAGARSGNPEIIRNFVASRQQEKNTNKTQENLADEKILKGKTFKENTKASFELSDITTQKTTTTTTTTPPTSRTTRMNLDELYLPNRCFDQGFWQEVELEI